MTDQTVSSSDLQDLENVQPQLKKLKKTKQKPEHKIRVWISLTILCRHPLPAPPRPPPLLPRWWLTTAWTWSCWAGPTSAKIRYTSILAFHQIPSGATPRRGTGWARRYLLLSVGAFFPFPLPELVVLLPFLQVLRHGLAAWLFLCARKTTRKCNTS